MSKSRKIGIAGVLLAVVCAIAGLLTWRLSGPPGPGRILVGEWMVLSTDLEEQILGAIEKEDPQMARTAGDKFRSSERLSLRRNGSFRDEEEFLGLTITTEGTWEAAPSDENTMSVKFHKTKMSVRDPKGNVKDEVQDANYEWVLTVIEPDRLSGYATHDKKGKRFMLRRAGN